MKYLRNNTKDPRVLQGRNGPGGIVTLALAPGETKPISDAECKALLANKPVANLLRMKLISDVTKVNVKKAADKKAATVKAAKEAAGKARLAAIKAKVKKDIVQPVDDDDLGLDDI